MSKFRLSFKEFNSLFNGELRPEVLVNRWLDDGIFFSSLLYHLKQVKVNDLIAEQLQTFIYCVLCFGIRIAPYHNSGVFELKNILREKQYIAEDKKAAARDAILLWLGGKISEANSILPLARFLNVLYVAQTYDEYNNPEQSSSLLISNKQIEEYLITIMKTYLDGNLTVSASDVLKERNGLAYLFKNCCVMLSDESAEGYGAYKQVAFDAVIEHFSQKDTKPTKEEFDLLCRNLFSQEAPVFTNPQDEYDYWEYLSEQNDRRKSLYFGDNYSSKLNEFRERCFS